MLKQEYLFRAILGSLYTEEATSLPSNPNWKALNSSWNQMNVNNVVYLMEAVKSVFEEWFTTEYVNSKRLIVINNASVEEIPVCWNKFEIIGLHIADEFWCQFIYQFAHELCHLMMYESREATIPREMMWFAETMCEASSLCVLYRLTNQWKVNPVIPGSFSYAVHVEEHYRTESEKFKTLSDEQLVSTFIRNIEYLRNNSTDRELNGLYAKKLHFLLIEHPKYWRVIIYICKSGLNGRITTSEMMNTWYNNVPDEIKVAIVTVIQIFGYTEAGGIIHAQNRDS